MKRKKDYSPKLGSYPQKRLRTFSEELKRKKVSEIEQKLSTVIEVSRSLEVSTTSVYRWLKKYSLTYDQPTRVIVESKSESKRILKLKEKIAELERLVGKKQIQLEVTEKMLDIASEDLGIDLKKKYATGRSYGTGKEGTNTPGK